MYRVSFYKSNQFQTYVAISYWLELKINDQNVHEINLFSLQRETRTFRN